MFFINMIETRYFVGVQFKKDGREWQGRDCDVVDAYDLAKDGVNNMGKSDRLRPSGLPKSYKIIVYAERDGATVGVSFLKLADLDIGDNPAERLEGYFNGLFEKLDGKGPIEEL